jgi:hypothetical protein
VNIETGTNVEAVLTYFKASFWNYPGRNHENHETLLPNAVFRPKPQLGSFRSVIHSIASLGYQSNNRCHGNAVPNDFKLYGIIFMTA